jgi:uncharacterized membrane protein (DUF485 family)
VIQEPTEPNAWERIERMPEFKALLAAKARFIVPATVFFITYYFALPALVGWAPKFMSTPVLGPVNIAYLFAISQFFVAWALAIAYTRTANKWDKAARDILNRQETGR